jgi:hypothetical protein
MKGKETYENLFPLLFRKSLHNRTGKYTFTFSMLKIFFPLDYLMYVSDASLLS